MGTRLSCPEAVSPHARGQERTMVAN